MFQTQCGSKVWRRKLQECSIKLIKNVKPTQFADPLGTTCGHLIKKHWYKVWVAVSHPRWSSSYRPCHWTPQGSQLQTWPTTTNFQRREKSVARLPFVSLESKPTVACRKILRHVEDPCSIIKIHRLNSRTFQAKFIPASLLGVSAGYYQTALVGESGTIRTKTESDQ
jgi:hypothetical protein